MLVDLGSFYLPPTCRARIVFKTSVLVGYTVFRVNMSDEMPRNALSTPLIGKQPWGHQTPIFRDSHHRSGEGGVPDTVAAYSSLVPSLRGLLRGLHGLPGYQLI